MTKSLHTHAEVEIDRRPEQVWRVVSDYATDTRWRKGIVEMTPDVEGDAQGWHPRPRGPAAGREELHDRHHGHRHRAGNELPVRGTGTSGDVRGRRSVEAGSTADSAVFTYDVELEPEGVPRIARPLLGWWLTRSLRRDLNRLRDLIEAA